MESLTERGTAMKQMLLHGYKEKLFADADPMKDKEKIGVSLQGFSAGNEQTIFSRRQRNYNRNTYYDPDKIYSGLVSTGQRIQIPI